MSDLNYNYHIFTTDQEKPNNLLEFYIFDLNDVSLGTVVMTVQSNLPSDKIKAIKEVVREVVDDFATTTKPLAAVDSLEKVFTKINNQIKHFVDTADLGRINSIFLYLKNNTIHFSLHGDYKLVMIRKQKIFDIIKMTYGLPPIDYDKLYARMYSGDINPGDSLLLATSESWDCFDINKIPELLTKLPAEGAGEFLKNYLPNHSPQKLGGMVVNFPIKTENKKITPSSSLSPSESINELLHTEDSTSQWLSPTPLQSLKKLEEAFYNLVNIFKRVLYRTNIKPIRKIVTTSGSSSNLFSKLFKLIKKSKKLIPKFSNISHFIRPKKTSQKFNLRPKYKTPTQFNEPKIERKVKGRLNSILSFPKNFIYTLGRIMRNFKKWPPKTRWLLLVSIILIAAFSFSISYLNKRNNQSNLNSNFNQSIEQIETLHTQANQATIFKDYARARTILLEANNLISQLPTDNDEKSQIKQKLLDENEKQLSRANRLTIIPMPLELADLNKNLSEIPKEIVLINNRLYIASSKQLVYFDINTNEINSIDISNSINKINFLLPEDPDKNSSNLLILHDDLNITQLNYNTNDLSVLNNTIDISNDNIADVAIFSRRLYRLDTKNNQIWRHLRSTASFQSAQPWLQIPNDLSQSNSFTIDGLLYLLDESNSLQQFNKGVKTDWQAEELEPSINTTTKILTTIESNYLYLLDPDNQRLIVYDKNGSFIQQLTSPKFDNLGGMAITEKNNQAYVYLLNGYKLYIIQFDLNY